MKVAIMSVIAAAAVASPTGQSAKPPAMVMHADVVWTLRFREHGKTVRTVTLRDVVRPLDAAGVAAWRHEPGGSYFWDVLFLDAKNRRLCGNFCYDVEPGRESFGASFNNLSETTTAVIGDRNTITLYGIITFDGNGAITALSADRWYTAKDAEGFQFNTPKPITVVSGQQLSFTVVISIAPRRS